jgi:hypothetical protein
MSVGVMKGSTRLGYTGFSDTLEHLKLETRLIDERFVSLMGESLMGECEIVTLQVRRPSSIFKVIRSVVALVRILFES